MELTWQETIKPTAPHSLGPPPTLALLRGGVLGLRPEKQVCETTHLAGISSAPWASLGALTKEHLATAHRALRDSCHLEEAGAAMALTFQWAPRSSTGQGGPKPRLCQHLTRNKPPRELRCREWSSGLVTDPEGTAVTPPLLDPHFYLGGPKVERAPRPRLGLGSSKGHTTSRPPPPLLL